MKTNETKSPMRNENLNDEDRTVSTNQLEKVRKATWTLCLPLLVETKEDIGYPLARVCSWCGKDLPVNAIHPVPFKCSHTICKECAADYYTGSAWTEGQE